MYRQRILDHLLLVSSEMDLLDYQAAVPAVDVSAEIVSLRFLAKSRQKHRSIYLRSIGSLNRPHGSACGTARDEP